MKTCTIDTLKAMGYSGSIEEFRTTLTEIKVEHFPGISTDELIYSRDEAGEISQHVKKRFNTPRLTRVVILRSLVVLRKNGMVGKGNV